MTNATANAMTDTATDDVLLADLLGQLGDDDAILETIEADSAGLSDDSGIIEAGSLDAAGRDDVDSLLDDVAAAAAKTDVYHEQPAEEQLGDAPETDPTAATEKPKKKGGKKGGKKADAAGDEEKPAAPPKPPRATSITHKPGELLLAKLGEKAADYLALSLADAELSTEEQAAKRDAFIARMNDRDAIATKVKEKMAMFFMWLAKGGELNEVLKRGLMVLHADGKLTSGDKGNLQLNLLAKPYSIGTARSQSNQVFMAFPELGLCIKEKGNMVPNPDSALLPMAFAMLGL